MTLQKPSTSPTASRGGLRGKARIPMPTTTTAKNARDMKTICEQVRTERRHSCRPLAAAASAVPRRSRATSAATTKSIAAPQPKRRMPTMRCRERRRRVCAGQRCEHDAVQHDRRAVIKERLASTIVGVRPKRAGGEHGNDGNRIDCGQDRPEQERRRKRRLPRQRQPGRDEQRRKDDAPVGPAPLRATQGAGRKAKASWMRSGPGRATDRSAQRPRAERRRTVRAPARNDADQQRRAEQRDRDADSALEIGHRTQTYARRASHLAWRARRPHVPLLAHSGERVRPRREAAERAIETAHDDGSSGLRYRYGDGSAPQAPGLEEF